MRAKASDQKRIKVITILTAVLCAISVAIFFIVRHINDRVTVEATPVAYVSTTYWGNTVNASGTVSNDLVQELYPEEGKIISDILVTQGQSVSIGDPVLQYDREQLELDLERKQLDLQKKDYEIEAAQKQMTKLQNTTASVPPSSKESSSATATPPPTPTPSPSPGASPNPSQGPTATPDPTPVPPATVTVHKTIDANAKAYKGDGSEGNPYVYLCEPEFTVTPEFTKQLLGVEPYYTDPNDLSTGITDPFVAVFEVRDGNSEKGQLKYSYIMNGIDFSSKMTYGDPSVTPTPSPSASPGGSPTASPSASPTASPSASPAGDAIGSPTASASPTASPPAPPTSPTSAGASGAAVQVQIYAVSDKSYALETDSLRLGGSASLKFRNIDTATAPPPPPPSMDPDSSPTPTPTPSPDPNASPTPTPTPAPNNYDDMGYTSSEISELIDEKINEIAAFQAERKQLQIDLDKSQLALTNSTVFSTVNGIVQVLKTRDEAAADGSPFIVISGSDEYYLSTALPETLLGKIFVGDILTANSWETGISYSCEIVSIDENPLDVDSPYFYGGNPNSSQYACMAVIHDSAGLSTGAYLDVTLVTDSADADALYLEKMYVREDTSGYYVFKRSPADGRLLKQYVNVGKSYQNWYIEILTDLSTEDYVAFPYGKDVKPGVRTALDGDENAFSEYIPEDTEDGGLTESYDDYESDYIGDYEDSLENEYDGDEYDPNAALPNSSYGEGELEWLVPSEDLNSGGMFR